MAASHSLHTQKGKEPKGLQSSKAKHAQEEFTLDQSCRRASCLVKQCGDCWGIRPSKREGLELVRLLDTKSLMYLYREPKLTVQLQSTEPQ